MENHLFRIIRSLANSDIDFVICGGVACVLQGCERTTFDIDINIRMNEDNLEKLITVAQTLQLQPRIPEPIERIKDKERREYWIEEKNALVYTLNDTRSFLQVDIFLQYPIEYEELKKNADIFTIEDTPFAVSNKRDLIEAKKSVKPLREKDMHDIRVLEELMEDET